MNTGFVAQNSVIALLVAASLVTVTGIALHCALRRAAT